MPNNWSTAIVVMGVTGAGKSTVGSLLAEKLNRLLIEGDSLHPPANIEKMSHGTPCFFVEQGKGCFAMFAEHHRDDGRLSLWVPVKDGLQPLMIEESPDVYFHPPYVGIGGWVGILLDQVADDVLESHLREARQIIASKRKPARQRQR